MSERAEQLVILLPGLMGDNEKLVSFRAQFTPDIRFIVPRYADWDEMVRRDASLALIVDEVVAQVLPALNGAPSALVGYSFGGLIAHEVAKVLVDLGQQIRLVAILDADITSRTILRAEKLLYSGSRRAKLNSDIRKHGIRTAIGLRAAYRMAIYGLRWRPLGKALAWQHRRLPPEIERPLTDFMTSFVRQERARTWLPRPHSAPTIVFRCKEQSPAIPNDLGWNAFAPVVAVEEIGGTHHSMLSGSHGRRLALALQRALGTPWA